MLLSDLSTFITFNPWSVSPATTLEEWLSMWDSAGLHHWPVVDEDRRLLALISNSDLMRALYARVEAAHVTSDNEDWKQSLRDCRLAEIMSSRVVATTPNASPAAVLRLMLDHEIHSLPVVQDDRLVGLVTSGDFVREFSYGDWEVSREMATEAMQRCEQAVDCECAIDEAAEQMQLTQASFVGVLRGDLPLGIASLRDLRMAKLRQTIEDVFGGEFPLAGGRTLLELAATAPTIRPGERLSSVAALMVEHDRQTVAVVNQAGRMLGVVSEDALLQAMLEALR